MRYKLKIACIYESLQSLYHTQAHTRSKAPSGCCHRRRSSSPEASLALAFAVLRSSDKHKASGRIAQTELSHLPAVYHSGLITVRLRSKFCSDQNKLILVFKYETFLWCDVLTVFDSIFWYLDHFLTIFWPEGLVIVRVQYFGYFKMYFPNSVSMQELPRTSAVARCLRHVQNPKMRPISNFSH